MQKIVSSKNKSIKLWKIKHLNLKTFHVFQKPLIRKNNFLLYNQEHLSSFIATFKE